MGKRATTFPFICTLAPKAPQVKQPGRAGSQADVQGEKAAKGTWLHPPNTGDPDLLLEEHQVAIKQTRNEHHLTAPKLALSGALNCKTTTGATHISASPFTNTASRQTSSLPFVGQRASHRTNCGDSLVRSGLQRCRGEREAVKAATMLPAGLSRNGPVC